jgi:predicted MFS family arabinose efflux permease
MTTVSPKSGPVEAAVSPARARLELLTIGFGALAVSLSQSMLIPVLGQLPAELDVSTSTVEWLITSTLLVGAIAVPLMGRLGDMIGKRTMMLVALAALVVGSAIDTFTSNIGLLIVGRAIQGLSMAAIPLGISLLTTLLPRERVGSAISLISAMLGVGGSLGLPLAGVIAEHADFHWLFAVTLVAGMVSFVSVLLVVPESPVKSGGRFDFVGAALLAATLVCLLLPLSEGTVWGWGSTRTVTLLVAFAVLLLVFVAYERRTSDAAVDVATASRPAILLTNLASVLFGFALFASFIGTAGYVEAPKATGYGSGASQITAGLCLLPSGVLMLLLSPVAARMIHRAGAPRTLALGAIVVAAGWLMRIVLPGDVWLVTASTGVIGVGVGVGYAAMPALINAHSLPTEIAAANGLNSLARSLGTSVASAVGGSILASSTLVISGVELPSETAYTWLFAVSCGAGVLAALTALLVSPRPDPDSAAAALHLD